MCYALYLQKLGLLTCHVDSEWSVGPPSRVPAHHLPLLHQRPLVPTAPNQPHGPYRHTPSRAHLWKDGDRERKRCWVLQYSPAVLQCASNFLPFFRRAALSVFADMIKCLCAIMHPIHWWFSERGGSRLLFFGTLDSGREEATGSASASLLRDERGTFSTPMNPCCTCHDSRREAV